MALNPTIERAIEIAAQWHDQTYRKGSWRPNPFPDSDSNSAKVPVIAHLVAVGFLLQRFGWDDATICAGFLHDLLEDADSAGREVDYDRLRKLVGEEVADLVRGVSEVKRDDSGRFKHWKERKVEYLSMLRSGSQRHVAISLADKIHNIWTMNASLESGIDIFTSDADRIPLSAGPSQQIWFFSEIVEISSSFEDERIQAMRRDLESEIERFQSLTQRNA